MRDIVLVSLARGVLTVGSREFERMRRYAKHTRSLTVVVLHQKSGIIQKKISVDNLTIVPTNSSNKLRMFFDAIFSTCRVLKSTRSDAIVSAQDTRWTGLIAYFCARWCRVSFHVQLHEDIFYTHQGRNVSHFVSLFLLKRACGIRVVSERIKRSLLSRSIDARKIIVLPILPDLERFLHERINEPLNKKIQFLALSRLHPIKNIPFLIHAFCRLVDTANNVELVIVGEGPEERALKALVRSLHMDAYIRFKEWEKDPENAMREADVFVLSSKREGYALTLIEAMASGLPIVTTDVGCVGEVVLPVENALVVSSFREEEMVEALRRIATDRSLRMSMGKRNEKKSREILEGGASYPSAWVSSIEKGCEAV